MRTFRTLLLAMMLAVPVSAQTTIGTFTGGDGGEGLDLDGFFPYALNIGGTETGTIRSATFTVDTATPGATVTANQQITDWAVPNYGATTNDNVLEGVMTAIRYTDNGTGVHVQLSNLGIGETYKVQLLFTESCCQGRVFDVFVEGVRIADEFSVETYSGINNTPTVGTVITHTFVAGDTTANITLDGSTSGGQDNNPILSAVTLEQTSDIPALDPRALAMLAVVLAIAGFVALKR